MIKDCTVYLSLHIYTYKHRERESKTFTIHWDEINIQSTIFLFTYKSVYLKKSLQFPLKLLIWESVFKKCL